jgi:DHA3 family macrolide efflux protein-like MFS transporter
LEVPLLLRTLRVLRSRDFLFYWTGQSISQFGSAMYWLAFPLWVLSLTNSALAAGASFMVQSLTTMILSPLAGLMSDRYGPKRLLVVADGIRAVLVCSLFLVDDTNHLWIAYAATLGLSALRAVFIPAQSVMIRRLTERDQLSLGHSLMSASNSASLLLGPVLGGVAVGLVGFHGVFAVNALSFLASAAATLLVRLRPIDERGGEKRRTAFRDLVDGLVQLVGSRTARLVVIADFVIALVTGANAALFVTYFQSQGISHALIGSLASAEALGMLGASIALGVIARTAPSLWRTLLLSSLAEGIALLAIVHTVPDLLPAAYVALVVAGVAGMARLHSRRTLLQMLVPDSMAGRVVGVTQFTFQTASLVALLGAGAAADWLSTSFVLSLGGVILVIGATVALVLPSVRNHVSESELPSQGKQTK